MAEIWRDGEKTTSQSYNLDTSKPGTYTVSISGDITDSQGNTNENIGKSVTITVNDKKTETTSSTSTKTTKSETKEATEPKFTSANEKMYATGDINLRSTWSTSSEATKIEKGTELTVTGKSTNKVNGYIWYKVSYEGKTKYVSSSLLTSKKPEEGENVNLKSLKVDGITLSPEFSADVLEYSANVGLDVSKINVKAEAEDEKAVVKIQGNETLVEGENTVKVIVTASDKKTTKTYIIKVTKQDEEEKAFGLLSLNIKDTDISSKFKTDIYEYKIDVNNVDKLSIEAKATDEDASIEIIGNDELVEGENIITIIVKSKDEKDIVTYQIKVNKTVATEEASSNAIDMKYIIAGVAGGVLLIIIIGVTIFVIKKKRNQEYDDDDIQDLEDYFSKLTMQNSQDENDDEIEDEDSDDYEEDIEEQEELDEDDDEIEELNKEETNRWGEYKSNRSKRGKHF